MNRNPDEGGTRTPDGRPWVEQPRWRRDFPIGLEADEYVSRRDFTKFMVLISSAFACGQLWIVGQNAWRERRGKPPLKEIARLSELPVGGSIIFRYPNEHDTCVLVRLGESKLVAFDQACTHLSCPVIPGSARAGSSARAIGAASTWRADDRPPARRDGRSRASGSTSSATGSWRTATPEPCNASPASSERRS
jgi:hypothetical protein